MEFKLNFHYKLKSIGSVNPKVAMLDCIANILACTYNNADFWGGANRYKPNIPQYPFIGGKKGQDTFYSGDIEGFTKNLGNTFMNSLGNLGSMLGELFTNPKAAIQKLTSNGGKMFMATKQFGDNRPEILNFKAILTGEPVGEWHVVIGNPFNPSMSIGSIS